MRRRQTRRRMPEPQSKMRVARGGGRQGRPGTGTIDSGVAGELTAAVDHHRAGRLTEAAAGYERILTVEPRYSAALHLLGVLALQDGDPGKAIGLIGEAIAIDGRLAAYHSNLGIALGASGRLADAEAAYGQAIALDPGFLDGHNNLASLLHEQGRAAEAITAYRRILALDPHCAEAHNNVGAMLTALDSMDEATAAFRHAIAIKPGFAEAHFNLGNALSLQDEPNAAVAAFRRAIACGPDYAEAWNSMGSALKVLNRFDEAVAAHRRALEIDPKRHGAHNNLAIALAAQGRIEEAVTCFRRVLDLKRDHASAHSNLLFCLCHDANVRAADILAEARSWNETHAAPLFAAARNHANDPDPERRLRVGYVSPDFRSHAVSHFLQPLVAHHDARAVELFCYAEVARPDALTHRYRELADHWRPTVGLSNAAVAELVREDRIDILVDFAGHTGNNRLLVFAERPAPVQLSHLLGLGQTTGMAAMDYVLTDARLTPEGHDGRFSETPWRLPRCFVSFEPSSGWPDISPLPAAACGHVTFAVFGNPTRIAPPAIAMWSHALEAVPGARLLVKHQFIADAGTRERLRRAFAIHGVEDRVDFEGVERGWSAEMDVYERVDIALDSFPMTGTTTACIQLWMGLPVVTLASPEAHDRFAADFLQTVGMDEGVAGNAGDFARCAAALAGDLDRLARLRAGLRQRMAASPLLDHEGCARAVEDAYRTMWRRWCARA